MARKSFGTLYSAALQAHERGLLSDAIKFYKKALSLAPRHPELLHYMGAAYLQLRDYPAARIYLSKSIELEPLESDYMSNFAYCLFELGEIDEAEHYCRKSLSLNPASGGTWSNLGLVLTEKGAFEESAACHRQALELERSNATYRYNLGLLFQKKGDLHLARAEFEDVVTASPLFTPAYNNLSVCCNALCDFEAAKRYAEIAISQDSNNFEYHANLGAALQALSNIEGAIQAYKRSVGLNASSAEAWNNLAGIYREAGRRTEALAAYQRALTLNPVYPEALNNLGNLQVDLQLTDEAVASFDQAIRLKPAYRSAWNNRGICLNDAGRHLEAIESYDRAIEIDPSDPDAYYNKSLTLLRLKRFQEGFELYHWRKLIKRNADAKDIRSTLEPGPIQTSSDKILVRAEQGIGDEVFYLNFVSLAVDLGFDITLSADARLHTIIRRALPTVPLLDRAMPICEEVLGKFDHTILAGDLAKLLNFRTPLVDSIKRPILGSDPLVSNRINFWESKDADQLRCGLSWRSKNKEIGQYKSLSLESFLPLMTEHSLDFLSLQYGDTDQELACMSENHGVQITTADDVDLFNDLEGVLALINSCDLVITSSNVVAHLAGSIGKRGAVLIPNGKGKLWYWHHQDNVSFWYPSLKIIYQRKPNCWQSEIAELQEWIKQQSISN